MNFINLSKKKFTSLTELPLKSIVSTEGRLFDLPTKKKWNIEHLLFKKYYNTTSAYFADKLFTIFSLMDSAEKFTIDDLVYPKFVVAVDDHVCGYAMPFVQGENLSLFLKDKDKSHEEKIKYLKQVGDLLCEMERRRNFENIGEFYLNDIHEYNFVIDEKEDQVKAVDLDSAKINGNTVFPSMYLRNPVRFQGLENKYSTVEHNTGRVMPSSDTELYCYSIMILNYLYRDNITYMPLDDFYLYLTYLEELGYDKQLITILSKLYTQEANENPSEYLETMPDNIRTCKQVFERVLRKNKM